MWINIAFIFLVLFNIVAIIFYARRFRELVSKQRSELMSLRKEFRIMTGSISEMGCHMMEIERQLSDVGEKQTEMVGLNQQEATDADYDQAKRLAEMGADVDEMMTTCGLTRAEAELLDRVRG